MQEFWQYLPYNIDPALARFGGFTVGWYWVMYVAGFLTVYGLLGMRYRNESTPFSRTQLFDVLYWMFIGIVVGARLGYVLLYDFSFFASHPTAIINPFVSTSTGWEWQGIYGMSYHGGLVGAVIALYVYAKRNGLSFVNVSDFIVPAIPLGYFWGRLGNFLNGELYGRVTDFRWGMFFPRAAFADGGNVLRHPSQLYEATLEGLALFLILWPLRTKAKRPGILTALYLAGYGLARFTAEYFREPDRQIGYLGSFTLGQILSFGMIIAGVIMLKIFLSRTGESKYAAVILIVFGLGVSWNAQAFSLSNEERAFIDRINNYRASLGLNQLKISRKISTAADWMTNDMAEHEASVNHNHQDSTGGGPSDRCARFGYESGCGENLAAGYKTAEDVFEAWKNSPGHNANMMQGSYKVMGVSLKTAMDKKYNWYWINDFGNEEDDGDIADISESASVCLVTVEVKTKNNKPAANAEVTIKNSKGGNLAGGTANENGIAVIEVPSPDSTIKIRVQAKYGQSSRTGKPKKLRPEEQKTISLRLKK